MVWDWYAMRRAMVAPVEPNAAHRALAHFEQRHPGRLTLITQNVDGLHQRAGSSGVLALHGKPVRRPLAGCAAALLRSGAGGSRQPAALRPLRQ